MQANLGRVMYPNVPFPNNKDSDSAALVRSLTISTHVTNSKERFSILIVLGCSINLTAFSSLEHSLLLVLITPLSLGLPQRLFFSSLLSLPPLSISHINIPQGLISPPPFPSFFPSFGFLSFSLYSPPGDLIIPNV